MKTELKAKFIQHLNQKKQDQGFTLIELLVVIIIIGILSAIALPSFLNQANKAKESEAKQYTGSMNRAQQAYYLEKGDFVGVTTDISKLGLGIATETTNYRYIIEGNTGASDNTKVANIGAPIKGVDATVRAFVGGVQVGTQQGTGEATTLAVLCQANKAPVAASTPADVTGTVGAIGFIASGTAGAPTCTSNYANLES
ncbi:MAG: type IV pilin-like G/H family protein [Coleofasciculus sp. B1-GNL1-01]|uniref:type IV pilin-like G/H family protein n=1 Tax=Coleofasciculus sp. B1-GNL1-01 TaxID=3068484 RepID=UPI0032FFFA8E